MLETLNPNTQHFSGEFGLGGFALTPEEFMKEQRAAVLLANQIGRASRGEQHGQPAGVIDIGRKAAETAVSVKPVRLAS